MQHNKEELIQRLENLGFICLNPDLTTLYFIKSYGNVQVKVTLIDTKLSAGIMNVGNLSENASMHWIEDFDKVMMKRHNKEHLEKQESFYKNEKETTSSNQD